MAFESPFTGSRLASIFGGGNNPFQARTPPFVPQQSSVSQFPRTANKRFMTSTLPTPNPVQSDVEEDQSGSSFQRYFDLLQKGSQNRPKQTAYEEALRSAPNREDYRPSGWRRFAAILGGAAGGVHGPQTGMGVAEHILTSPYQGALQDYEMRVGAAEQEAQMEYADRSDYRENLKTAATLGQAEDTRRSEIWNRRRQREIDQQKAETDFYEAQSNRQNIISQINRRLAETTDDSERRELERQKIEIERGTAGSMASYRNRMAGAAERQAGAAETRAEKYTGGGQTRMPQVDEQQVARDLVLEEMSGDPRYSNFIRPNQDKYGPAYTVESADPKLLQEIQNRIMRKIQSSYPNYGSDVNWNSFGDTGDSQFEFGPPQR